MRGRVTRAALRALDGLAAVFPHRAAASPAHLATGRGGEEEAYFHLRRLGYVMVARNYRSPKYRSELDLIGWDGDTLCFIEVKTRTSEKVMPAEAAVDAEKQQDLSRVAREYLRRLRSAPPYRFDILSVYVPAGAAPRFTLFKNAFPMS
jgi:putative endonuclease